MNPAQNLRRIEDALARPAYIVPTVQVANRYREPLAKLADWMARPSFDGELAMAMVRRWREEGALDEERMAVVGRIAQEEISPISDVRGSAWYRRELTGTLTQRLLRDVT